MKIKSGFRMRHIANTWLAVPTGTRTADVSGVITLSESGALLWKQLEKDTDMELLVKAMLDEYEIDEETARRDTEAFVDYVRGQGWLDE